MKNRKLLDDLEQGEDEVLILLEDVSKRGVYMGFVRMQIGFCVRWYIQIELKNTDEPFYIETCEIKSIRRIREKKNELQS